MVLETALPSQQQRQLAQCYCLMLRLLKRLLEVKPCFLNYHPWDQLAHVQLNPTTGLGWAWLAHLSRRAELHEMEAGNAQADTKTARPSNPFRHFQNDSLA